MNTSFNIIISLLQLVVCVVHGQPYNGKDDNWVLEELKVRSSDEGSGNDGGNHDLVPDQLGTVEILAIIIGSIIVLGIVILLGSCAWHKARTRGGSGFNNLPMNEDDSALNMVNYDDLSIQNATLSMDFTNDSTTPTESDT